MKNQLKSFCKLMIIVFCFVIIPGTICAQKVKIKQDIVTINEKEVFIYKAAKFGFSLYNIKTNDEVIFIKEYQGTNEVGPDQDKDNFIIYNFLKEKIKVEIAQYYSPKTCIMFLFNEGVFDLEGNLYLEKITLFKEKYDEAISEKIVLPR
ncbi:MAG: hypothetical protein EHM20_15335 [Alphaproteobacteria bacterium]|nr:MAG: hypothetical protein EHM20_15335 [Alphaproteobacteria bacterium]